MKKYITFNLNYLKIKNAINILSGNEEIKDFIEKLYSYGLHCIYIINKGDLKKGLNTIDYPHLQSLFEKENFNDMITRADFSKYLTIDINPNAKNFNELFIKKVSVYVANNYKINSCLINCVIDNFKDSFD